MLFFNKARKQEKLLKIEEKLRKSAEAQSRAEALAEILEYNLEEKDLNFWKEAIGFLSEGEEVKLFTKGTIPGSGALHVFATDERLIFCFNSLGIATKIIPIKKISTISFDGLYTRINIGDFVDMEAIIPEYKPLMNYIMSKI